MSNRLRTNVITLICVVWAMNFCAPMFNDDYKPRPEINLVFGSVVTAILASYRREVQNPPPPTKRAPRKPSKPRKKVSE